MSVVPGNTFVRVLPGRRLMRYVVRAVRWAPVRYAEIEPVGGGRRASVPLHLVASRLPLGDTRKRPAR